MKKFCLVIAMLLAFYGGVYLAAIAAETGSLWNVFMSLGCIGIAGCFGIELSEEIDQKYKNESWWSEQD